VKLQNEIVDANILIEEIHREFDDTASMKDLRFEINGSSVNGRSFIGDQEKINSVLFILLNNAFKFTDTGKITLDLSFSEQESEFSNITLKDTGVGIDSEELEHIYQPLRHNRSTSGIYKGFGMATCKKLVNLMGGTIEIESKKGQGTTVEVSIPVKQSSLSLVKKDHASEKEQYSVNSNPKALIVDDLAMNRTLARIILETHNFITSEAENGKEAVELFCEVKPDVVLMDISMPVLNGVDAMKQIRELTENESEPLPIIAITAGGHAGSRTDLIKKGFSEYIQKPFREEELVRKISMFLRVPEQNLRAASEA
jgi:CheY-like chemotaxis protein